MDMPHRKHPEHGVIESRDGPTIVFDTVCTKGRAPILASAAVHGLLRQIWTDAEAWRVGRYVIMPDHLHYFATNIDPLIDLDRWVRYWKSQFTKHQRRTNPGAVVWQTDHWDVTIRTWQKYDEKWEYVRLNPVRHGLVADASAWPFQGEIHRLEWD